MVVCATDRPRSAIISTRSRRLSLKRRYQRTHRMMTSRSKWRPSNSSSTLFSLPITGPQPFSRQHSRSDRAVCTRAVRIAGKRMYLWRAVDSEGEVLDILVQVGRDKAAALKLMRKLLKKQRVTPTVIVTDKLQSYAAAFAALGLAANHERGLRQNNRAEVSHQP